MNYKEKNGQFGFKRQLPKATNLACLLRLLLFSLCYHMLHGIPTILTSSGNGLNSWSQWTPWSICTKSIICNSGTRQRKRSCSSIDVTTKRMIEAPCLGSFMEQEDCPKKKCTKHKHVIFSDVAEAPLSSFISQECDTDAKFAVASMHGNLIPQNAFHYCKSHIANLFEGYFNIKRLQSNGRSSLGNMTKICFEPRGLTVGDVHKMTKVNRVVRATLHSDGLRMRHTDTVTGIAVVLDDSVNNLQAFYFAVPSERLGYKKVGYRRWRGIGVLDSL